MGLQPRSCTAGGHNKKSLINRIEFFVGRPRAGTRGHHIADGASVSTVYDVCEEATSSTTNYREGGVNKTITTTAVYDGWGQMTSSVDANGAQTNYSYSNMGRMKVDRNGNRARW